MEIVSLEPVSIVVLVLVLALALVTFGFVVVGAAVATVLANTRQHLRGLTDRVGNLERRIAVQGGRLGTPGGVDSRLEDVAVPSGAAATDPSAAATAEPLASSALRPQVTAQAPPDRSSTRLPESVRKPWLASRLSLVREWFAGGNTVVRVGVVILFFGVAFFLNYVAERDWLPTEVRLAAAAVVGFGLLVAGWRLQTARREYALTLQGCGAGIVYLTVFAGVDLYELIPALAGVVMMLALVLVTAVLALRQDARSLAVLAVLGGFLGPVLVSRGGGHVSLFAYYATLNVGIAAVAWFRAWRVLNLLGFVFTFVVGAAWGWAYYQPEHFDTTQPFLALFFAIFVTVPVFNAWRQPPRLTRWVDGPLVFGMPLAAFALQHQLASGFEYGPAVSALAFAIVYAGATGVIHRWGHESMYTLARAFTALAVAFGTLAVPLAVDGRWTAAAWALEGAALVWVGVRQSQRWVRLSGLALQVAAGIAVTNTMLSPPLPVLNIEYLGRLMVSLSGLFSAWCLYRIGDSAGRRISAAALAWGIAWWVGSGIGEIVRHLSSIDRHSASLGFLAASAAACAWLRVRFSWSHIAAPPLLLFPMMLILAVTWRDLAVHPLAHWGVVAWPSTFLLLFWVLWRLEADWRRAGSLTHAGALWLGVFLVSWEGHWRVLQFVSGGVAWAFVASATVPAAVVWGLATFGSRLAWPVLRFRASYLGPGQIPLALAVSVWVLIAAFHPGDPYPLGYLPLLNPVELGQLGALGFLVWWSATGASPVSGDLRWAGLGVLAFTALNGVVGRAVHFLAAVPFRATELMGSAAYQTTVSIVWTAAAFVIMFSATRLAWRRAWWVGAVLLAAVVIKLFTVDLVDIDTIARMVSFVVVGGLVLVLGYVSPLPPKNSTASHD